MERNRFFMDEKRKTARQLAQHYLNRQEPLGWFEALYAAAGGDADSVPWADLKPNPILVEWLNDENIRGGGKKALKVGCGLGDDAELLSTKGFDVTAFDISSSAVDWCRRRFPDSSVTYESKDLFESPPLWHHAFDFVLESYTLQVLPPELRPSAMEKIAGYVAPGGTLLAICRGREPEDDPGLMPWPIMKGELESFKRQGLVEASFEDFMDGEDPPVRRFRVVYRR